MRSPTPAFSPSGSLPCWLQYEANERADLLDFKPARRRKKPASQLSTHLPLSALAQYFQALPPREQQLFEGEIVQRGIELPVFWTDAALPASDTIPFSRLDCYRTWFLDQGYADLFEHLRQQLAEPACSPPGIVAMVVKVADDGGYSLGGEGTEAERGLHCLFYKARIPMNELSATRRPI